MAQMLLMLCGASAFLGALFAYGLLRKREAMTRERLQRCLVRPPPPDLYDPIDLVSHRRFAGFSLITAVAFLCHPHSILYTPNWQEASLTALVLVGWLIFALALFVCSLMVMPYRRRRREKWEMQFAPTVLEEREER